MINIVFNDFVKDGLFKKLIHKCRCRKEKDNNGKIQRTCKWKNGHKTITYDSFT